MYPFFETIRFKNGIAENLSLHQQRVDNTIMQLGGTVSIQLASIISSQSNKPAIDNNVYKCRVKYNLEGEAQVEFEPYTIRSIRNLSIQDIGAHTYPYKYTNREWLTSLLIASHADELILTQNGFVKDATYANLVFFNGEQWITPSSPLLYGTRRAQLLEDEIIIAQPIHINELQQFKAVKLINAMMLWEESPLIEIASLK